MLRKIGSSYQVALPREVVRRLKLKPQDLLEIRIQGGKIVMEPQVSVGRSHLERTLRELRRTHKGATPAISLAEILRQFRR
ncbi:MAG: AbrB/MazE/SpoVT family DNA-binding domain-containing protein [Elusimicrobia bacterium]|nr:AbrB/MazE/SpoVT family DNA-binding domain-containing protein [Elusimicrobiota bacterium]